MYGFGALLAFGPVVAMGLLALWSLFHGLIGMAQYNRKRYRVVPIAPAYVAGARASLNIAGPFNELHFSIVGGTAAHVLDGAGVGIVRSIEALEIVSNKRGSLAQMSGVTLYALSSCLFNTAAAVDTVGGGAADGFRAILPIGVNMDETIAINIRWGTAVEVSSTAGAAAYAGVLTLSVALLDQNPETYWAYRDQEVVARGVAQIAQQPTPFVVPGFVLCKEVYATQSVSLVTNLALLLANVNLQQSDDVIVNMAAQALYDIQAADKGFAPRNGYLLVEHRPISNNDATILTLTNGAVAIFAAGMGRMCYVYQGGKISESGRYITPPTADNPEAAQGAAPNPKRSQTKITKSGVRKFFR